MRNFDWNDVFRLPDAALAGDRRIPKTVLTRQALLTKTEQKVLDRVSALTHFATVQKSTTRVQPVVDEAHDIQSVLFLRCEMARGATYAEVARLIHKCFPNPTVLLFGGAGEACISVATTRKSLAEQGATVIDGIESTGAFDVDNAAYASFLDALAFERLPQADLLSYLDALTAHVVLSRVVESLGFFPACNPADRDALSELVTRHNALRGNVELLAAQHRDATLSLNESAKVRVQLKKTKGELASVIADIRGLCHV